MTAHIQYPSLDSTLLPTRTGEWMITPATMSRKIQHDILRNEMHYDGVTVTDALGRQVVTQLPFYASAALLAPKLQTYSGEIGFVRRNWGVTSDDYRAVAAAITYRRGLTSHLTIEGHAEKA